VRHRAVGFYLDEVPLSPPALSQSGKVVIDPDLYDIERIEVLRGPQGTLYGSGSMGGTIKLVTAQPKLNTWEGSFQGTLSDTQGGGGNGGGNVMLNIPIGDNARAAGGRQRYLPQRLDRSRRGESIPAGSAVTPPAGGTGGGRRSAAMSSPLPCKTSSATSIPKICTAHAPPCCFNPIAIFPLVATAFYQRLVVARL